jgi:hypothetical protein
MPIKNQDGTDYQLAGGVRTYRPDSPELDLFNLWDQEMIQRGGAPVHYHEVFISLNTIDPVYNESRAKIWSPEPVELWAVYEPVLNSNILSTFGFEGRDEVMFELNLKAVLEQLGHLPKIGSRLYTLHRKEHWRIDQRAISEFKLWGQLRLQLMCKRWQDDKINPAGIDKSKLPDFKMDSIR